MSQFNIRNIREISNAPLEKFVNTLAKRVSRSLTDAETAKLENKEDIYSAAQDVDSVVKYHNLISTNSFDLTTEYFSPNEPDLDKLTLWIQGRNMGNELTDLSGFNNVCTLQGDPLLIDGTPFDDGTKTGGVKSYALKFNRPTSSSQNEESVIIPHSTGIGIDGIGTGISYFIRFRTYSMSEQGGSARRLFEKHDTIDPVAGESIMAILNSSNNRLSVQFNRSGSPFEKLTPIGSIQTNTVYDVWITYAQSGGVLKIYINGVDQTLTDGGAGFGYHSGTDTNLTIMHSGGNDTSRHVYGDLYDFRIMREKVVSSTEVTRHFTNKLSISDIPFGQVMVSNYFCSFGELENESYTSASYTSQSYNI